VENLSNALYAWREAIGTEHVITADADLQQAETATYLTEQRIPAILRPANRDEVQACVKIANQCKTPLYPISTGKNWGYGSSVPVRDNCVVLDLGRMDRIVSFDEDLAYITVEPGVTQQQVYDFLREKQSDLFLGVTGGPRDSSLIGATMDRGVAKGPYGDRFQYVLGTEAVLPTGECIHTGFGRFEQAQAGKTHRWGVGPYLDGLFSQSNLGIVTQMTFLLSPIASHFQICIFTLEEESQIEPLFDTLRTLLLRGTLDTAFVLSNDYRMFSYSQQYPWAETGGQTPLPAYLRENLREKWQAGLWFCEVALYSQSLEQAQVERNMVDAALRPYVSSLYFIDEAIVQQPDALRQMLPGYDPAEVQEWFVNNLQRGIPSDADIPMTYWRKSESLPAALNPDRDRCGFIWCAPVTPFVGSCVRESVAIVEETCQAHGYEPSMALNCINARNIYVTAAIIYDREVAGEDERAMACYEDLLGRLVAAGYLPYRLGTHAMNLLPPAQDDYNHLLRTLKQALDPNDILAPGRYDFRHEWEA